MQIHFLLEARRTNVIPAAKFAGCLVNKKEHIHCIHCILYSAPRSSFCENIVQKKNPDLSFFTFVSGGSQRMSTIVYHTIPSHTIPLSTIPYHTIPCYTTSGEGSRGMSTKGKRQRWHSGVTFAQGGKEIPSRGRNFYIEHNFRSKAYLECYAIHFISFPQH